MLRGLVAVIPPEEITAVVNTADDLVIHGLHVSPDIDTVIYTLAGAAPLGTGWGLAGDTWNAMEALARYTSQAPPESRAGQTWFRLGDRDLGTHLYRTQRLAEEANLSEVVEEMLQAWDVRLRVLPMSDDSVETRLTLASTEPDTSVEIGFQDYFVRRRHAVPVEAVRFEGIEDALPAPGVLEAISSSEKVVVCPSNPIVSIGPIIGVRGVAEALRERRDDVVAISPIVAGAALRGPADRLMEDLGHEASVVGVARLYAAVAATLVVDVADAALSDAVEAEGVRCVVAPTVMTGAAEAAALARTVLAA
jgi:LPPG:FO 2-phospho-L-lactate transferase